MNTTQVAPKTQPKTAPNLITIGDTEIRLLIYKGLPVVTFQMIDKVHGRPARTAVRNFEQNRSLFLDGEDFFLIKQSNHEIRDLGINVSPRGSYLITETGYLMLVKSFTDDLAWQVQRELVNKYFATPQPATPTNQMLEYAQINKEFLTLFGIESNMQTIALNNAMQKKFGVNMLETWDVKGLKSETQDQTLTVSDIANQLSIGKHKVNPILIEMDLQTSARDHKNNIYYELTNAGKKYAIYVDTGKRHKTDGSPVRQIKWYASVVEVLKAHLKLTETVA